MKNWTLYLLLTLLALTALLFASCSREEETAPEPPEPILLIGENAPTFTLVRTDMEKRDVIEAAVAFRKALAAKGFEIKITTDWEKNPIEEHEIVFGDTTRDEEFGLPITHWSAGPEGYYIYVYGGRIYIDGGTTEALKKAGDLFISEFLSGAPGEEVIIPGDYKNIVYQQFPVNEVTIDGVNLRDFRLDISDKNNTTLKQTANLIQWKFYSECGIYLPLLEKGEEWDGPIFLLTTEVKDSDGYFTVAVEDGDLVIRSPYVSGLSRGFDYFWKSLFAGKSGTVALGGGVLYEKDISKITYKEFGAAGDGVTNDIDAIIAAHEFANESGLPVTGDPGATYYISTASAGAIIRTDTDWTGCTFIIDDSKVPLEAREVSIFTVESAQASVSIKQNLTSLKAGQKDLGITLKSDSVVVLKDSKTKRFMRYSETAGLNTKGTDQQEVLIVSKDGKVAAETAVTWDWENFTSAVAYPIDEKTLTLKGGTFRTIANTSPSNATYYKRGILVKRSNVVIEGLVHTVEENPSVQQACYSGILSIDSCANVTVKNCAFCGQRAYDITRGSYDITPTLTANLTFTDCTQVTNINDTNKWGIMASNYCKNVTLLRCSFSRFDAHCGVQDLTIRDCQLGHQGISVVGFGKMVIENTTVYGSSFINLRSDYGSFWNGSVEIRNCTWVPLYGKTLNAVVRSVFYGLYNSQFNFGVACGLPETIAIDGLKVSDKNHTSAYKGVTLFANVAAEYNAETGSMYAAAANT